MTIEMAYFDTGRIIDAQQDEHSQIRKLLESNPEALTAIEEGEKCITPNLYLLVNPEGLGYVIQVENKGDQKVIPIYTEKSQIGIYEPSSNPNFKILKAVIFYKEGPNPPPSNNLDNPIGSL